ncbi:Protein FAF-like, chloroplastic [Apostasia shenzhenica]|uniref:Protein FAF-like, chloroplastic n=1 Tax=Apostasia shenzhenica TaxID=1088818 RepID=A0A2I0B7K8_9ASPA|nr:Protein FAF-like, chloroplastic [Apostasia shenzhenica]
MAVAVHRRLEELQLLPAATEEHVLAAERKMEEEKEMLDIWSSIQREKAKRAETAATEEPYVHPLLRRSSSLMSGKSLEICTESLGSETGSDGFSSACELDSSFSPASSKGEFNYEEAEDEAEQEEEESTAEEQGRKELNAVNYHCSIGWRSLPRSFPPPLPSISRCDGPCIQMKPHRRDGRLVVTAVPVPAQNFLHAERQAGRLRLSFIDSSCPSNSIAASVVVAESNNSVNKENDEEMEMKMMQAAEEEAVEEEEEEEVEVVDRGTVVEVKFSAQPQQVGGATAVKVHRSSLVINKFVVGNPAVPAEDEPSLELSQYCPPMAHHPAKRSAPATATVAAAAVAASSVSTASTHDGFHYNYIHSLHLRPWGPQSPAAAAAAEAKLLFVSKRRSREELLHDMRRCNELRRPLFIFEQPCCIATSS